MRTIGRGQTPFSTQNAILAYCLHMAGVPWANIDHPIKVVYSEAILNKFTNGSGERIYKGWEFEKAVRDAHEKGRRGHIEYMFQRTQRLDILLKTYERQVKQLEKDEGYAHELVQRISEGFMTDAWDVTMVRLACVFLKMRVPFMEKWQHMIPWIVIRNEGRVTRSKGMINTKHGQREADMVSSPGWKMIPLNASKEMREKFGL